MAIRFTVLPPSLKLASLVLILAPVVAAGLAFLEWPSWRFEHPATLGLAGLAFLLMPWLLAVLLAMRSGLFPQAVIFFAACLFGLGFCVSERWSLGLAALQFTYIMICAFLALLMVNRDLLFPFLLDQFRGFRRAPRLPLNQMVGLHRPHSNLTCAMMLEDCSLTGAALYGDSEATLNLVSGLEPGDAVILCHTVGKAVYEVPMALIWTANTPPVTKIGLMATNVKAMERCMDALGFQQNYRGLRLVFARLWTRGLARRVASYALLLLLVGAMATPVLVRRDLMTLDYAGVRRMVESLLPMPLGRSSPTKTTH